MAEQIMWGQPPRLSGQGEARQALEISCEERLGSVPLGKMT
jgi:hypothetical protein